ncbi:MAG: DEAD/DEAH box helicase [Acidobacteriota bacterium]
MRELIDKILASKSLGKLVKYRGFQQPRNAVFSEVSAPLPEEISLALKKNRIERLYLHQTKAIDAFREGKNIMVVTPTASGKSLTYYVPTFEAFLNDAEARALYIFPYKALEQDQLKNIRVLACSLDGLAAEIYDGDTTAYKRKKIKANPPSILITNPDMLHMGILAYHGDWQSFFENLKVVIIDELHVYRGIFGTHLHHVIRRLKRICRHYGVEPRFIVSSATIANPEEFAFSLTGIPFHVISENGAPSAGKHFLFINPDVSPYTIAAHLFELSVKAGFKSIAFTKARKITELIHSWLITGAPELKKKISSYRAGYLPEERREIEAKLFSGDLMGVISTSALEHGIDVGGLDVCILVGYPGSITSSWQRIGRVGRSDRESLVILVALPDALDQYFIRNPEKFFGRSFEKAVLDPENRFIMLGHLVCAGAEIPLRRLDSEEYGKASTEIIGELVRDGRLVEGAEGDRWFSLKKNPQRDMSLRSIGEGYRIFGADTGKEIGTIDGVRALHECHKGAIYLHHGVQYKVTSLDMEAKKIEAKPVDVDYYTQVYSDKETEILEMLGRMNKGKYGVGFGRLRVTEFIREYVKKRIFGQEVVSTHPLALPPLSFETMGLWMELPDELNLQAVSRGMHFMGGLHAMEHASISLFPLLAICDRDDIGGISYTLNPQLGKPAIFIYDGYPGGIGLAAKGFQDIDLLLERTYSLVSSCDCDDGCPSCIHSPKCGSGNKPLDKLAAIFLIGYITGKVDLEEKKVTMREKLFKRSLAEDASGGKRKESGEIKGSSSSGGFKKRIWGDERVLFFDVETQKSAEEVGGWRNVSAMRVALAVIYDVQDNEYRTYFEKDVDRLISDLLMADLVIGFNIDRFDVEVLRGYTNENLSKIKTLDMLAEIYRKLGFRLGLGHLAEATLGEPKSADGFQSLQWFKEGKLDLIEEYCRKDVEITKRLFEFGREKGYLLYRDYENRLAKLNITW